MATVNPMPMVTYVTDPGLTLSEQRRVLRDIVQACDGFRVRIAFRLPGVADDEFVELMQWYWGLAANRPYPGSLREPLFHHRLHLVHQRPDLQMWAPARLLETVTGAHAYSVHDGREVQRAVEAGAKEVIYGHVFATDSHPGQTGHGITGLMAAQSACTHTAGMTVTAIGGIHEGSIDEIGRVGVQSVACMRAFSRSPDIRATLWRLHQNWNTGYSDFLRKGNNHVR